MKLSFSLKNKEASLEADVEGLVEKGMEQKSKSPIKKTRYQIKQEEKRATAEQKHKQQMQYMFILWVMMVFLIVFAIVAHLMGI